MYFLAMLGVLLILVIAYFFPRTIVGCLLGYIFVTNIWLGILFVVITVIGLVFDLDEGFNKD